MKDIGTWTLVMIAALGPVIGWISAEIYQPDVGSNSFMGVAVAISWMGFWGFAAVRKDTTN